MLTSVVCAAILLTEALGSVIPDLQKKSEGALRLDFNVRRPTKALFKRDGSEELELDATTSYYECTLYLGSQGTENIVMLDTGSADLWVMDSNVACYLSPSKRDTSVFSMGDPLEPKKCPRKRRHFSGFERQNLEMKGKRSMKSAPTKSFQVKARANSCLDLGSFNTDSSDSFKLNSSAEAFYIEYMDDSYALGVWGTDNIRIGNQSSGFQLTDASFAVVNQTSSDFGVLGIGLPTLELTYSLQYATDPYTYENFPMLLKSQGYIARTAYSLHLTRDAGSVLFGAVDHAKYSGTLQTVPMLDTYLYSTTPIKFYVMMNSILMEGGSSNFTVTDLNIAVLLDSGTTLSYLPYSVYTKLGAMLGGTYTSYGYRVSCSYHSSNYHFVFNFSGIQIRVPFNEMILEYSVGCYLSVSSLGSYNVATFGNNFLRSAYVVHDLDNYEILMAQFNDTGDENIEVISLAVPLAVQAEFYSATSIDYSTRADSYATPVTFQDVSSTGNTISSSYDNSAILDSLHFSYSYDSYDLSDSDVSETAILTSSRRASSRSRISLSSGRVTLLGGPTTSSSGQMSSTPDQTTSTTILPATSSASSLTFDTSTLSAEAETIRGLSTSVLLSLMGILVGLI